MSLVSFSDPSTARSLLDKIARSVASLGTVRIMEVCGTHTMEIGRTGLRSLLPKNVELVERPRLSGVRHARRLYRFRRHHVEVQGLPRGHLRRHGTRARRQDVA